MHGASWSNILQLIPAEQHAKLVLITHNNTEIHVQGILHTANDYLLIRGRLAASTDAGRVFFIPFDQMHYLAFRDPLSEADTLALLGLQPGAPATRPPAPSRPAETTVTEATPPPAAKSSINTSGAHAKAALLERLRRARGQDGGGPHSVAR